MYKLFLYYFSFILQAKIWSLGRTVNSVILLFGKLLLLAMTSLLLAPPDPLQTPTETQLLFTWNCRTAGVPPPTGETAKPSRAVNAPRRFGASPPTAKEATAAPPRRPWRFAASTTRRFIWPATRRAIARKPSFSRRCTKNRNKCCRQRRSTPRRTVNRRRPTRPAGVLPSTSTTAVGAALQG